MHPVEVELKDPKPFEADYTIDLSGVPSASDVPSSRAAFFKRAAAYTLANACRLLPYNVYRHEEEYMETVMAKLAYENYYHSDLIGDHCPGRDVSNKKEAFNSLLRQHVESKVGTTAESCGPPFFGCRTGEYDVALSGYIAILNLFGDRLPENVSNHILNELLDKRGPLDWDDHSLFGVVQETENHVNMIESSRFLTNELLFARTGDSQFDNSRNAVITDPNTVEPEQLPPGVTAGPNQPPFPLTVRDYWLRRLHHMLQTDFIEYNARPYQDYTMHSIQNLYSFAHDKEVKAAAEMVLNYVYAKLAVSSNDNRRSVPYRRKKEYNDPNLLGWHSDPQAGRMLMLAGDLSILGQTGLASRKSQQQGVMAPWYDQDQWTLASSYQIPDLILDLIINHHHRIFYQGLHHYADEIYAGSPSYLISAGGHYATPAYKALGIKGSDDDIGLALPTTVMPTGFVLSRDDLIRFEGSSDDTKRSNMCVAPNFACGINPKFPETLRSTRQECFVENGPWTFINFTSACRANDGSPSGFYAALYQREDINLDGERIRTGFVEVFDTRINPSLSFSDFWQGDRGVIARNRSRTFKFFGTDNVYVTTTGREIGFELAPDSRIIKIVNGPAPVQSTTDMATGIIIGSSDTSGLITITNPFRGAQLIMDDRDPASPKQTSQSVPAFEADTCLSGFVWRGASPADHICVTVQQRQETESENSLAQTRRSPNGGPFGPDTCLQGFVWREAFPADHVCVPPSSRDQARWDNKLSPSRQVLPKL
jgi:hypothetical protein